MITGAGAGVGRATVSEFARNECDVGLLSRDPNRLENAAAEARAQGVRTLGTSFAQIGWPSGSTFARLVFPNMTGLGGGVSHYDLIVVGSGPGGASLVHRLAPTGKRILLIGRGDYLPPRSRTAPIRGPPADIAASRLVFATAVLDRDEDAVMLADGARICLVHDPDGHALLLEHRP